MIEQHTVDLRAHLLVPRIAAHMPKYCTPISLASPAADEESFAAGQDARWNDAEADANPYSRTSWDWHSWRSGWLEADIAVRRDRLTILSAIRATYTYGD